MAKLFGPKAVSPEVVAEIKRNQREANLRVPADINKPYVTVSAAAQRLHVSKSTIYRWMKNGKLTPHYEASKAGPKRYFVDGNQLFKLAGSPKFLATDQDLH